LSDDDRLSPSVTRADQFERYLRKPLIRTWFEILLAVIAMRIGIRVIGLIFSIPPLAHWMGNRPERMAPLMFVFLVPMILIVVSIASGWWGLSLRYKTNKPRPANRRTGSAGFRYVFGYNNVLRLGSDSEGLFISSWVRLFHPPLFIPWHDVEVGEAKRMLFQRYRILTLGPANRVPVSIDAKTSDRLLAARNRAKVDG